MMTPFTPLHRSSDNPRPVPSRNWLDPLAAFSIPMLCILAMIGYFLEW
jgi:hypothetical protein